jgi:hypothetical protein
MHHTLTSLPTLAPTWDVQTQPNESSDSLATMPNAKNADPMRFAYCA